MTESVDDSDKNFSQSGSPKEAYPNLSWRDSQLVILNLNADFSGILFAPNSPVAINGHNLHGFVVAKEFVRVTTANDYTLSNGRYFDGSDATRPLGANEILAGVLKVYTYEDNYTDDSKTNSVDMFFTTVRSSRIT